MHPHHTRPYWPYVVAATGASLIAIATAGAALS